jgi:alkyl hydroperoxide reductase subunit AhpC
MNTLRLAEEAYINKGKWSNAHKDRTSLDSVCYPVIADNDQSTRITKTAKYGQST